MRTVMVASEALPFVKVGGLADVVAALSRTLAKKKVNVSVVIPLYSRVKEHPHFKENATLFGRYEVRMSWRIQKCEIFQTDVRNVRYYFIGNDYYFSRGDVYGYNDDIERYAFFSLAAYRLIRDYLPKTDVVHLHDWQASAIPMLYLDEFGKLPVRTMLTIHNPCFQGICSRGDLPDFFNLGTDYFDDGLARLDDNVNLLKSAIMLADRITTVSPTHQKELLSGISSYGLEKILHLRRSDFVGILNGLDTDEFDPKKDPLIVRNYGIGNALSGKKENKEQLCRELNLVHGDYPLFCIVGRLTYQKGIGFIIANLEKIFQFRLNLVILGQGEEDYEHQLSFYCRGRDNVSCNIRFSNEMAHRIYAASDFLLMPSIFEPCGIAQMIAMRYGTLPIGSKVGGLIDTIDSYNQLNEDSANGLLFHLDDDNLLVNIIFALNLYEKKRVLAKLIHNAMRKDFSWDRSAEEYLRLYRQMLEKNHLDS